VTGLSAFSSVTSRNRSEKQRTEFQRQPIAENGPACGVGLKFDAKTDFSECYHASVKIANLGADDYGVLMSGLEPKIANPMQ
jgi:hypothetical protein